jgi:hypothetical protein
VSVILFETSIPLFEIWTGKIFLICIEKAKELQPTTSDQTLFQLLTSTPWCLNNADRHFVPSVSIAGMQHVNGIEMEILKTWVK